MSAVMTGGIPRRECSFLNQRDEDPKFDQAVDQKLSDLCRKGGRRDNQLYSALAGKW